jgi:hypothetical protein
MSDEEKKGESTAPAPRLCPKCRGTMFFGFIPELRGEDEVTLLRWHFGSPDPTLESGASRPEPDDEIELYAGGLVINAYRCEACGYLEFFAN